MGLAIEVGLSAELIEDDEETPEYMRDQFAKVNTCLVQHGLPEHNEPETGECWSCDIGPYSLIHELRRFAVYIAAGRSYWDAPGTPARDATEDPLVRDWDKRWERSRKKSLLRPGAASEAMPFEHLIMHSDAEGYYLPIAFERVLVADARLEVAGHLIGSSVRLQDELLQLYAALGLPEGMEAGDERLWDATDGSGEGSELWQRLGVESLICVSLLRAAEASIRMGAAIVFC